MHDRPTNHDTTGDQPTADTAAERALLACLITQPELLPNIPTTLGPDMWTPLHEQTLDAIRQAAHTTAGDPALTPAETARILSQDRRIGPREATRITTELLTHPCEPLHLDTYTTRITDTARLRDLIGACRRIIQTATTHPDDIDTVLAAAVDTIDHAATAWHDTHHTTPADTGRRDLTWLLDGKPPIIEPPAYGHRSDGTSLFYPGRVNGIFGDPEAGKTWLAKLCITEALAAGTPAAIIDVDHNGPNLTTSQLLLLGATPTQLADPDLFRYYDPDGANELRAAISEITAWQPALLILDSLGEMMPMLGVKSVDNDEITAALRELASTPAAAGICVITIDHLPKSHEARSTGFAIGGTAKKRALDGTLIHAQAILPPAPGQLGKIALRIEKDRPGAVRENTGGKYVGELIIDSRTPNVTRAYIHAAPTNEEGTFMPTMLMEKVSRLLEDTDGINARTIRASIHGKGDAVTLATQMLIREGHVRTSKGTRGEVRHWLVQPYRNTDESDRSYDGPEPEEMF